MARRKNQKRRTNRFKGINVTDAALGYAGVAIWSDALLGVGPIEFFTDKTGAGSSFKLTAREIFDSLSGGIAGISAQHVTRGAITAQTPMAVITRNAKTNGGMAIVQSVGLTVLGTVGKKVTRKPRAFINKNLKMFGMGEFIRF